MGRLIDTDSLKDRASEYTLNEDEYADFARSLTRSRPPLIWARLWSS